MSSGDVRLEVTQQIGATTWKQCIESMAFGLCFGPFILLPSYTKLASKKASKRVSQKETSKRYIHLKRGPSFVRPLRGKYNAAVIASAMGNSFIIEGVSGMLRGSEW
jgi:hypothetical protein